MTDAIAIWTLAVSIAAVIFGLIVITGGVWGHVQTKSTCLIFGIISGLIAILC